VGLAKYLADDWVCVGPRHLCKAEFLQNVQHNLDTHENGVNPYTIEKKNLQVRVFGDTAVVTYIKENRQTPDTSKLFNEDDTDVFTRDASGWHLHYTRIYPVQSQSASN
jgi:ketosteroid isomerase-like protein